MTSKVPKCPKTMFTLTILDAKTDTMSQYFDESMNRWNDESYQSSDPSTTQLTNQKGDEDTPGTWGQSSLSPGTVAGLPQAVGFRPVAQWNPNQTELKWLEIEKWCVVQQLNGYYENMSKLWTWWEARNEKTDARSFATWWFAVA